MLKLISLFPNHLADVQAGHVLLSLYKEWKRSDEILTQIVARSCDSLYRDKNIIEGIPILTQFLVGKFDDPNRGFYKEITEKLFLRLLKNFDLAYLCPGVSEKTIREIKQRSQPIFRECINSYQGTAKLILDDAYSRLGLTPQHPITDQRIQREKTVMQLADFIFCPSPEVKKSFQTAGISEQKLILTTYGWSPQRLSATLSAEKVPSEQLTFLFMGSACVRKGIHLLLRVWEKAGVKGKLIIFGKVEPAIKEVCGELLARPDVIHREFSKNYTYAYQEADVFVFPTLEEGSPLVVYEAIAHGLPILTSPMGAGSVVRDGMDGMVIPPYEEEVWIEALRKLADSQELRTQLGLSARERAKEFTWEKVAARREALMQEKLKK